MTQPPRLDERFIHLGLGATAVPQPPFDGMEWYGAYGERHGADGREGRLVSQYTFTEDWPGWEMHPARSTAPADFSAPADFPCGERHGPRATNRYNSTPIRHNPATLQA